MPGYALDGGDKKTCNGELRCMAWIIHSTVGNHSLHNFLYTDIDECAVDDGGCIEGCTNTVGSFECQCNRTGYEVIENSQLCVGECRLCKILWMVEWSKKTILFQILMNVRGI